MGLELNVYGLMLGATVLLAIGLCHLLVMKGEYYWGTRWWPVLLFVGSLFILISVLVDDKFLLAFSFGPYIYALWPFLPDWLRPSDLQTVERASSKGTHLKCGLERSGYL